MSRGKLNKRIIIGSQGKILTNENGFPINNREFIPYKPVWASINNLFGKEFWAAKAVNSEKTLELIVRYSKDLAELDTKKYQIKWNNKIFDITFIDNIKYENKWLKIKCKVVD